MRAALYVRVSTPATTARPGEVARQDPRLQKAALEQLARARGWEDCFVFEDRASGARSDRAGYRSLREAARRGEFQVVAVWRFDRLARSARELLNVLEEFRTLGIDFVSHREAIDTATPAGKMMYTIVAAFAEFERELIRERVLAGLDHARANGTKSGRAIGRPVRVVGLNRALQMRNAGLSWRAIGLALELPESTVRRRLKGLV